VLRSESHYRTVTVDREAAVGSWLNIHAMAMLAAAFATAASGSALPIAATAAVSFSLLWRRASPRLAAAWPQAGLANLVTALRLALVLGIAAFIGRAAEQALLALFIANVVLDVIDGRLARSYGQATRFGAVFDREADATFVLVAYAYFHVAHDVPAWILVPGILPYVYRLAFWTVESSPSHGGRQRLAVVLAGVNYVLLVAAVAVAGEPRRYALAVSTTVVMLSFLVSFWNMRRNEYSLP